MNTPNFVLKLLAKMFANMMYKPSGAARPSKKVVMERTGKDLGMDIPAFYSGWEKEEFLLPNDGIEIPAEYHPIPNGRGVAILAHGFGQNRYAMLVHAKLFRDMGYSTLIFDQRHFGMSKAPNGTFGVKEATDIVALTRWAKKRCGEDTRIVVLGVSMGAMALMHAMALTDQIDAAIEDCGPTEMETVRDTLYQALFGKPNRYLCQTVREISARHGAPSEKNRPVDSVAASDIPLLVIHGEEDSAVPLSMAGQICEATKHPLSRMKTFPGREHAFSIQDSEEYAQTLQKFLDDVFPEK